MFEVSKCSVLCLYSFYTKTRTAYCSHFFHVSRPYTPYSCLLARHFMLQFTPIILSNRMSALPLHFAYTKTALELQVQKRRHLAVSLCRRVFFVWFTYGAVTRQPWRCPIIAGFVINVEFHFVRWHNRKHAREMCCFKKPRKTSLHDRTSHRRANERWN